MRSGASRSNGTKRAPAAQYVRFTEEQNDRLAAAAKFLGVSINAFLVDAALRKIGEIESQMNTAAERRKQAKEERLAQRGGGNAFAASRASSGSMGIRAQLEAEKAQHAAPDIAPPPAEVPTMPTIIIQNGPAAAPIPATSSAVDLDTMARRIADAHPMMREEMTRMCVDQIKMRVTDQGERERAAAALDEKVKAALAAKPAASGLSALMASFGMPR